MRLAASPGKEKPEKARVKRDLYLALRSFTATI